MSLAYDELVKVQRWLRKFNEEDHDRVPAGSPEGGQFTSGGGGGGGDGAAEAKPSSGEFSAADFAKAGVTIEGGAKAIERWNDKIGIAPGKFRDGFLGGAPGTMTIKSTGPNGFQFNGELHDKDGNKIGGYTRSINMQMLTAQAINLNFEKGKQGKGAAKAILAANIEMYKELGVEHVEARANVDVGGYAWAKYGYVPDKGSWNSLSRDLRDRLREMPDSPNRAMLDELANSSDPKSIWAISDSPFGKDLLLGTDWEGTLDLNDYESMKRFGAYVGK